MRNIISTLCVFWYQFPFGDLNKDDNVAPGRDELLSAADKFVNRYKEEINAGSMADMFSSNRHVSVPTTYKDFGRRFVPQYPYYEKEPSQVDEEAETRLDEAVKAAIKKVANDQDKLTPVKAPPEVVLAIARESLLRQRAEPKNDDEDSLRLQKEIMRSGDYWNGVWKEDVPDPVKSPLRSSNHLESVQVKIMPGSKLYKLVKMTKNQSPRLLYVINK